MMTCPTYSMTWVVTMWLLVCVCFAECVDDGEIIVVLSFADRNTIVRGISCSQTLDVSWQHTGQQQHETDEWRWLCCHQQRRLRQCVRSASPARKPHVSLWMLRLGTHSLAVQTHAVDLPAHNRHLGWPMPLVPWQPVLLHRHRTIRHRAVVHTEHRCTGSTGLPSDSWIRALSTTDDDEHGWDHRVSWNSYRKSSNTSRASNTYVP